MKKTEEELFTFLPTIEEALFTFHPTDPITISSHAHILPFSIHVPSLCIENGNI
jgi:hypothetical protein